MIVPNLYFPLSRRVRLFHSNWLTCLPSYSSQSTPLYSTSESLTNPQNLHTLQSRPVVLSELPSATSFASDHHSSRPRTSTWPLMHVPQEQSTVEHNYYQHQPKREPLCMTSNRSTGLVKENDSLCRFSRADSVPVCDHLSLDRLSSFDNHSGAPVNNSMGLANLPKPDRHGDLNTTNDLMLNCSSQANLQSSSRQYSNVQRRHVHQNGTCKNSILNSLEQSLC